MPIWMIMIKRNMEQIAENNAQDAWDATHHNGVVTPDEYV